jgi:hypothetical protein
VRTVLWLAVAGALASCEVAARRLKHGWPTAVQLLARARSHIGGRLVLVAAWLWLGWHVFAR